MLNGQHLKLQQILNKFEILQKVLLILMVQFLVQPLIQYLVYVLEEHHIAPVM